jgi:hypothetical protein
MYRSEGCPIVFVFLKPEAGTVCPSTDLAIHVLDCMAP